MIEQMRPLIEIMAAERTKESPHLFEECVQEGMIAAWQAMEKHPHKDSVYYRAAARNGVINPLRGRSAFGAEPHRGTQDAWGFTGPLVIEVDGVETLVVDPEDPHALEAYDAVGYDAVHSAVADLAPEDRALVHGRYWADKGFKELSGTLGRPEGTLSRRWTQNIRPQLAEALEEWAA